MSETRVLLLSLEYAEPWIFSGNGVYCRSFVHNLCKSPEAPKVKFLVICGRPNTATSELVTKEVGDVQVLTIPLSTWYKLDRNSSWKEFGLQISKLTKDVLKFDPHLALGVDWTVKLAWERLGLPASVPFVFLCFRCFSGNNPDGNEQDQEFYSQREKDMLAMSTCCVALSSCDADSLRLLTTSTCQVQIIPPPLRDDLFAMATIPTNLFGLNYLTKPRFTPTPSLTKQRPRIYITCVCRIVQCKQVLEGFVQVCESIRDFLVSAGLVPYLVGPSFEGDEGYSLLVYQRLKRAFPGRQSVIRSEFVGAAQLANIFQQTAINIHPAQFEPFGMTIVEAAAFGVPTLMHYKGVGAADLLPPARNLSLACDLARPKRAGMLLRALLRQPSFLQLVGTRAQQVVLQWDSLNWAKHVKRELLIPHRNNSNKRGVSAQPPAWPWGSLALYVGGSNADPALVEQRVRSWLARHTEESFAVLLRSRKPKLLQPFQISPEMFQWGNHFCQHSDMLRQVRFRFVPSRLPEKTFWGIFFLCVRQVCGERDEAFKELESLVQCDDARGIQTMARALGEGQLKHAASALVRNAKRVLILTGFPCCSHPLSRSKQETDGPPGAVGLCRALVHLGKHVHLCIEQVSASVMEACLGAVFPVTGVTCHGTKRIEFGPNVTLEIFPSSDGDEFTPEHHKRLDDLKQEFSERNQGHLLAIERAGPGLDGKCRTMRGVELQGLAPLHLLFEGSLARTTAIGDGGNEVGMGNVHDLHLPSKESACITECTYLLPCSVSNWGALALCAAMCLVACIDREDEGGGIALWLDRTVDSDSGLRLALQTCVDAGASDGITMQPEQLSVDGMPFEITLQLAHKLRAVVTDWAL
ncbi:hypothetical protein BASA81_012408 [Batrachochytrium salamandrivorans]|nr:hypothetical protein BASA81_012408 [Batrachochytrium salamandrivorans]